MCHIGVPTYSRSNCLKLQFLFNLTSFSRYRATKANGEHLFLNVAEQNAIKLSNNFCTFQPHCSSEDFSISMNTVAIIVNEE